MSETKPPRKLGLNQVFPSPTDVDGTAKKTVDVVAIHGLDTRSPTTWIAWKENGRPESGDVHWLKDEDMLPRVLPNSRIFTYDWNANIDHDAATQSLLGHADKLLNKLRIERAKDSKNRPIVFIASCFGGLLLAKALLLASEAFGDYQEIYQSTNGAVFLGTPFQGTNQGFCTAAHLRVAVAVSSGSETTKELLTYLRNEPNERGELDQLVERFCVMINHEQFIIPVVCFYETQETDFTKVIKDLPPEFVKGLGGQTAGILVPKSSACLQGKERHELSVRHSMLSKFARPDEDSFETVCYNLKDFVTKAEKRLRDRMIQSNNSAGLQIANPFKHCGQDKSDTGIEALVPKARSLESLNNYQEQTADITILNKDRATPVYIAACNGHVEVVKLLLENGADITISDKDGWTPVSGAAIYGHVDVVKLLLENGADITIPNYDGWTPITGAANNGHVDVVKLLLENGAGRNPNKDGTMPGYVAASN